MIRDLSERVPVLIISGSMGAGKTTVLSEASDLLAEVGISHGAIDLDWLGVMHPPQGTHGEQLALANLAAVWPQYKTAGARRLLLASVVEDRAELQHYKVALPGAEIVVCRLIASSVTMQDRLRVREPGLFQPKALARSMELDSILSKARIENFVVYNDAGRPITEVAREVLTKAGWL